MLKIYYSTAAVNTGIETIKGCFLKKCFVKVKSHSFACLVFHYLYYSVVVGLYLCTVSKACVTESCLCVCVFCILPVLPRHHLDLCAHSVLLISHCRGLCH